MYQTPLPSTPLCHGGNKKVIIFPARYIAIVHPAYKLLRQGRPPLHPTTQRNTMSTFNFRMLSVSLALAVMFALSVPATGAETGSAPGAATPNPEKQNPAGKLERARKLYEDFHNSTLATRQELLAKRRELDAQMYSSQSDEQKIQALAKEIADLRAKLYSARIALKNTLIKEGIPFGRRGYGPGMGRGPGCCGPGGRDGYGGFGCGGYGPGMGRGYGPGPGGGGAPCCGGPGGAGGYGPGMGRGYGPGPGGWDAPCCSGPGMRGGPGFGTGSGMRGYYGR